ncbi:hypothetical protein Tco_0184556 [Tanacetum coccineum]
MSNRFAPNEWCRIGELNGVPVALVARFGVISKGTDRIFVSHGVETDDPFDDLDEVLGDYANTRKEIIVHVVSPNEPIVRSVNINTKPKSYVGVAGASAKDQPIVSNFWPLVADPVFDGVNISIPRKVIEKDDISLIATFIGKPIILDSYTSSMCNDSWGRSSFARCLIEVNSDFDILEVVTTGVPSLTRDDFTKETIRVDPHIVTNSNVVTPIVEKTNDGFQTVGKMKKRNGKSKSTNGGQFTGHSVKQNVRYEPKATTSAPKKGATNVGNSFKPSSMLKTTGTSSKNDNIITSNSYSTLIDEEEEVENVYDESANLFQNTKTSGSSSFTAVVG